MLCAYRAGSLNTSLLKAWCQALLVGGAARGGGFLSGYDAPLSRPWWSQQLPLVPISIGFRMEVLQGSTSQWTAFPSMLEGGFRERSTGESTQLLLCHSVSHGQALSKVCVSVLGSCGEKPCLSPGVVTALCVCHSFNLYCYFLLASPSLLQSSGVVIFKFKLLCGFCFLIGSLLLSCIIVAFHPAKFFVPPPAETSLPLL